MSSWTVIGIIAWKPTSQQIESPWWLTWKSYENTHYNDVIMGMIPSQITSLTIVYSAVYSGADQRKHQSSASLAFVQGIHQGPVNSLHKWPVTLKMFPFEDVIMTVNLWTDTTQVRTSHHVHWNPINVVSFLQNNHERYSIAHLRGWAMECVLWVQSLHL